MKRDDVYAALDIEREYQQRLWGEDGSRRPPFPVAGEGPKHSVGNWIVFMRHYLRRAEDNLTTKSGHYDALDELRKVAALAVACFEQHGVPGRKE